MSSGLRRSRTAARSCGSTGMAPSRRSPDGLDRPTSVEMINNTAYVVTLGGEVWRVDNIAGPPFGH